MTSEVFLSKGTQHSETPSPAPSGTCVAACRAPQIVAVLREDKHCKEACRGM